MSFRHHVSAVIVAAALLSGCNDDNTPRTSTVITNPTPPPGTPPVVQGPKNFSEFAASLIAMVMGLVGANGCATALPADINGSTVSDDMVQQDANAITVNCT